MATRAIITHQPEVSCDMCGRTLLRGERPDTFLAAGSRRTVCELCIPRAAGEGWMRESDALAAARARPERGRRGRSLLDRLRQRRGLLDDEHEVSQEEQQWARRPADDWQDAPAGGWSPHEGFDSAPAASAHAGDEALGGVDLDALEAEQEAIDAGAARDEWVDRVVEGEPSMVTEEHFAPAPAHASAGGAHHVGGARQAGRPSLNLTLEQAIEIFNASECAARVAGIARALGQPSVTVRASEHEGERAAVVVAWELCWYRYEVDLRERPATIALLADGTELDELAAEDRLGNASADERGELSLLR
jgi:hypothetical protein